MVLFLLPSSLILWKQRQAWRFGKACWYCPMWCWQRERPSREQDRAHCSLGMLVNGWVGIENGSLIFANGYDCHMENLQPTVWTILYVSSVRTPSRDGGLSPQMSFWATYPSSLYSGFPSSVPDPSQYYDHFLWEPLRLSAISHIHPKWCTEANTHIHKYKYKRMYTWILI